MALLEKQGDRAGALRVYEDFAGRLRSEFGVEPDADTSALREEIIERERAAPRAGPPDSSAGQPRPTSGPTARKGTRFRGLLLAGVTIAAVVLAVIHLVYVAANRAYAPAVGRQVIADTCDGKATVVVEGLMQPWKAPLLAVERVDPYLAQWLTGFLSVHTQNAIGVYPSYVFGRVSSQGRWWYFPAVLLIKTPLVILIVTGVALARRPSPPPLLLALTAAVYLLAAVTSNYNLGVRHLLPIMPFLFLPLAVWLARRPRAATAVLALLAFEAVVLTPRWMSQTNTWWLGARNPTRFALSAGDLEYRQSLVQLARWARAHDVERLKVLYPALGQPVIRMYLPDARLLGPGDRLEPGWYAVDVTVEQLVPALRAADPGDVWDGADLHRAAEQWWPFWQALVARGEERPEEVAGLLVAPATPGRQPGERAVQRPRDPADLPVAPLPEDQFDVGDVAAAAADAHVGGGGAPLGEPHPALHLLHVLGRHLAAHPEVVGLGDLVARVGEPIRRFPVRRKQQQAAGHDIEPADVGQAGDRRQ